MSCKPACPLCRRLREVALELVGDGGVDALSLESLARGARLTPAEVAEHYPTVAGCLYDTYDQVSVDVLLGMADAFAQGSSWQEGFLLGRRWLLDRVAARPAEARLCFVEVLRGDRELRRRRDATREWIVEFLMNEYRRRRDPEGLPEAQVEMLIAAGFQAISSAVGDGGEVDLASLEAQLAEFAVAFDASA